MKRFATLICVLLLLASLSACQVSNALAETGTPEETTQETTAPQTEASAQILPEGFPMEFTFSSGAGAWRTTLTLQPDGSFTGMFLDSEMGSIGDGYPNGTAYISVFEGKFEGIEQVNDYTYSMTLGQLQTEKPDGEVWIEDGIQYIASTPYGLTGGTEFTLYLPQTPITDVSEFFLSWWPYRYTQYENPRDTLDCYGILNVATYDGFFSEY